MCYEKNNKQRTPYDSTTQNSVDEEKENSGCVELKIYSDIWL